MAKFRATATYSYWWPVTVSYPDPDPAKAGEMTEETFKARFSPLSRDEGKRLQDEIAALPAREAEEREHDMLLRVTTDWDEDVVDEAGAPVPFSEDALRGVLQSGYVRLGLYLAYLQSVSGAARRKN